MSRLTSMSGIEKAAIVLNVLDPEHAGRLLQSFSRDDLSTIKSISKSLEPVSKDVFAFLVEEFSEHFSDGIKMLGSSRNIGGLLEEVLTPDQVAQLNTDANAKKNSKVSVWDNPEFTKQEVLEPIMGTEHPQLAAALLSRLNSDTSSRVIAKLSDDERNDIMFRMLKMRTIKQEIICIMEDHIRGTYIENDESKKGAESRSKMAMIINKMDKEKADTFLLDLAIEAPEETALLKKLLFAFEDIPVLATKDRLTLFDKVPTDTAILALNGLDGELKEIILSSFGGRVRKMIESELSIADGKDPEVIESSRRTIANIALDLAAKGEISIDMEEDE